MFCVSFRYTTCINDCNHELAYILFSPDDSGHDTSCLDDCNTAFCMAIYYSTKVRTPSQTCTKCDDPTDFSCLRHWSKCVKKSDKVSYGLVSP